MSLRRAWISDSLNLDVFIWIYDYIGGSDRANVGVPLALSGGYYQPNAMASWIWPTHAEFAPSFTL
jgi:hypothetical protein